MRRWRQAAVGVLATAFAIIGTVLGPTVAQADSRTPVRFHQDRTSAVPVQDQLTAVLATAAASHRSVTLPAGRLTVTRTLWLPNGSNLVLARGASIAGAVPGQSLIRLTSHSSLTGGRVVNTADTDCFDVDFAPDTRDATLEGVAFSGSRTNSVYLNTPGLQKIRILRNTFRGVVYGVLLNSGALRAVDIRIADNSFTGVSADAIEINAAVATDADMARDVVVSSNRIRAARGAGDGAGFGIGIAGTRDFRVISNRIDDVRNEAVHLEYRSTSGLVANNDIRGGGIGSRPAIAVYRTVRSVIVRHNSIHRFAGDGIAVLWDSVGSSRNIEISGNLVSKVSDSAVVIGGDAGTGPFMVRDNDLLFPGRYGVVVLGTHARSTVAHNVIRGAHRDALFIRYQGDGVRHCFDNGPHRARAPRTGSSLPGAG